MTYEVELAGRRGLVDVTVKQHPQGGFVVRVDGRVRPMHVRRRAARGAAEWLLRRDGRRPCGGGWRCAVTDWTMQLAEWDRGHGARW